jgi:peptidoglycan/LPS O-acetylase OafA/YrhL
MTGGVMTMTDRGRTLLRGISLAAWLTGLALILLPRLPFWIDLDIALSVSRLLFLVGVVLLLFGFILMLALAEGGERISRRTSGLVLLALGGVLFLAAVLLPSLMGKSGTGIFLALLVMGPALLIVGLVHIATGGRH